MRFWRLFSCLILVALLCVTCFSSAFADVILPFYCPVCGVPSDGGCIVSLGNDLYLCDVCGTSFTPSYSTPVPTPVFTPSPTPSVDDDASFWEIVSNIPGAIFGFLKDLFIPDSNTLSGIVNRLGDELRLTFGFGALDLGNVIGQGTVIDDSNHVSSEDYYLGIDISGVSFMNTDWLYTAVVTFRPYIRGFFVLLLILYNTNQFCSFIGAGSLSSLGSALSGRSKD